MGAGVVLLALFGSACGTSGSITSSTTTTLGDQPSEVTVAVRRWLSHLAAGDDIAAFADLAPRSKAAVGDLDQYRRGSGTFASIYRRFATGAAGEPLALDDGLAVVPLSVGAPVEAVSAVPVRRVGSTWMVDPILDAGSYTVRPGEGETVGPRPDLVVQLDDDAATATLWFDGRKAERTASGYRPATSLAPGSHVVTLALVRRDEVIARAFRIEVDVNATSPAVVR